MEDEYLDVVDDNDVVVGKQLRSEVQAKGLRNYRAVALYVRHSNGTLWIPRRTAAKRLYPLGLDMSCAGHVESGESYEETLRREVMEELNIDLSAYEVRYLGAQTPAEGFSCFGKIYEISSDEAPVYNPEDFVEYFWLTPEQILDKAKAGEIMKSDMPLQIEKFYLNGRK